MDTSKDSGVSPVIATVLLIALSVVLIALVAAVVMASISSFTPVENKVVRFTVEVNATNNTALITPVAGTDLPFMTSYRVYTNNGHWDSPDAQGIQVPDFNSTVTYVNIVGNFSDRVTALVFSGKVVIEGGVIIVTPVENPYYIVGEHGYTTTFEFVDSINEWYNKYYNNASPGDPNYEIVVEVHPSNNKDFTFTNENPIIVGDEPIELSPSNIQTLSYGDVKILIENGGNFERAPDYNGALLQIGNPLDSGTTKVTITKSTGHEDYDHMVLNGIMEGQTGNYDDINTALIDITSKGWLVIEKKATLILKNNRNVNGDGFGGGIFLAPSGKLDVNGDLDIYNNTARYGGGIYRLGTVSGLNNINFTNNYALVLGDNIYP
ncbi:type IV pilin N-terminal domain-containing protein [uncultured Methanocorpusculum sp.]|nr:type IV pilin N-terminal domain-containing protein [uncultured Methanocorpusculum sp.]